jgi:hypothetical protein
MLKKSITFENFDGVTVTKDYYFNITKAEIALRELESDGTWSETLEAIKNSDKGSVVLPEFRKIIQWMYGEKDGDSFVKTDAAWERFNNSEPWSVLIMELLTNAGYAADFITAAMPADMQGQVKEAVATDGFRPGADISRPTPPVATQLPAPVPTPVASPKAAEEDEGYQNWLIAQKEEAEKRNAPQTDGQVTSAPRTDLFPSE